MMTEMNTETEITEQEEMVCTGCTEIIPEGVDFCPKCGAPLGPCCWLDPIKRIHATGHVYRSFVSRPIRPAVFVIVMTYLVIMYIANAYYLVETAGQPLSVEGVYGICFLAVVLMCISVFGWRMLNNYMKQRKKGEETRPEDTHVE